KLGLPETVTDDLGHRTEVGYTVGEETRRTQYYRAPGKEEKEARVWSDYIYGEAPEGRTAGTITSHGDDLFKYDSWPQVQETDRGREIEEDRGDKKQIIHYEGSSIRRLFATLHIDTSRSIQTWDYR